MRCYFNNEPSPGHGQLALILSYFHKEQPDNLLRFYFSGITTTIFSWSWKPPPTFSGILIICLPACSAGIFPSQWSFDSGYLPKPLFFFFFHRRFDQPLQKLNSLCFVNINSQFRLESLAAERVLFGWAVIIKAANRDLRNSVHVLHG